MDAARIGPDTRDPLAAMALNNRLAKRCDLEGLQVRRDSGDIHAMIPHTLLLVDRGDLDRLRARAGVDLFANGHLINVLEDRGKTDESCSRADTDTHVAQRLAHLLSYRNNLRDLGQRANRGDFIAAERLASVLAARGDLQGLRSRADRGDSAAAAELARVLADRGDLTEAQEALRTSINLGHKTSALIQLSGILHRLGEPDEAGNLARFGLNPDGVAEDLKTNQAQ